MLKMSKSYKNILYITLILLFVSVVFFLTACKNDNHDIEFSPVGVWRGENNLTVAKESAVFNIGKTHITLHYTYTNKYDIWLMGTYEKIDNSLQIIFTHTNGVSHTLLDEWGTVWVPHSYVKVTVLRIENNNLIYQGTGEADHSQRVYGSVEDIVLLRD